MTLLLQQQTNDTIKNKTEGRLLWGEGQNRFPIRQQQHQQIENVA